MSEPWQLFFFRARAAVVPSWRDALPRWPLSDQRQSTDQRVQLLQKRKQTACLPPLHAAPGPATLTKRFIYFPETVDAVQTTSSPQTLFCPGSLPFLLRSNLGPRRTCKPATFWGFGELLHIYFVGGGFVFCFILFKISWLVSWFCCWCWQGFCNYYLQFLFCHLFLLKSL